jgi:hypothetical protein
MPEDEHLEQLDRKQAAYIASCFLTTTIAVFPMMPYPPITSNDAYLQALEDLDSGNVEARDAVLAYRQALSGTMDLDEPTSPVESPPPSWHQDPLPTHPQEFSPPRVFNEAPLSPLTPTDMPSTRGATPTLDPSQVPIGSKLAKKRTLPGHAELSVFDILNTFRCRWFVSTDHLRTAVLSAQKDEAGKIFWVEFTPHFHAHLVKCAVALVPHPLLKVKRVMFVYLLELLNGEGPQSFFDLSKGQKSATQAEKEKRRLAWRRNRASRRERRKAAEEAAEGRPHRQCKSCGRKFSSRKAEKRHRCPISKEASGKSGPEPGKGKTKATPNPNKPGPSRPPAPSAPHLTPQAARPPPAFKPPPTPTNARKAFESGASRATARGIRAVQTHETGTSTRRSTRLNTTRKVNERKELLDSLCDSR